MKEYPSIPKVLNEYLGREIIAFKKYDGSNLRTEFSKKKGWHKFGTRTRLFGETDPTFGCAIEIFHKTLAEKLEKIIVDNFPKADGAIVYAEFVGPHSFAGLHDPGILGVPFNDPKELVVFDVNINKRGFIDAEHFVKLFTHVVRSAEPLYTGKLTENFIKDVREGVYGVDEGVVCKGQINESPHSRWMCKIKTYNYLEKIKKFFKSDYNKYWE